MRALFYCATLLYVMQKAILADQEVHGAVSSLFLVPRGIDRIREGRRLAASLITDNLKEQQLVLRGVHPALMELVPLPGKEKIGIDRVRAVIRGGQFTPVQGKRKACLITHAEALTSEAANALLKVLEEPPRDLVFLLLAKYTGDILPTILSRSRVVRLKPPSQEILLAKLTAVGYSEEEGRYLIAVTHNEEELDRFITTREDIATLRTQAKTSTRTAIAEVLATAVISRDPILRHEGILSLLDRLMSGEMELAVVGARILAKVESKAITTLLEDLMHVSFDLVRTNLSVPVSYRDETLISLSARVKIKEILRFSEYIERARQAVEGHSPLEAVLLWLLLAAGRL